MKNIVLLTFAMATSLMGFAQKGEIIYTHFEPDSTVHFHDNYGIQPPNLYLDIDHDGTDDTEGSVFSGFFRTIAMRFLP